MVYIIKKNFSLVFRIDLFMEFSNRYVLFSSLVGLIFIADLFTPLGIAVGVVYSITLNLLIGLHRPKIIWFTAGLLCLLTFIVYLIKLQDSTTIYVLYNRIISLTAIVFTAMIINLLEKKVRAKEVALTEAYENLQIVNNDLESFSYGVSHDLKAPLRSLKGFSELLKENYENTIDEQGVRWLNFISNNAEQMDSLIRGILDYSRIGKMQVANESVDAKILVQSICNMLNPEEKYSVLIGELPTIRCDRHFLEIVFLNLIENAIKYSAVKENPTIEIGHKDLDDYHCFYVKDNGVGFDEQFKDKLFLVFQRLHQREEFEGSGIGLASVKRCLFLLGGDIQGESEIGKGATFTFKIPKR